MIGIVGRHRSIKDIQTDTFEGLFMKLQQAFFIFFGIVFSLSAEAGDVFVITNNSTAISGDEVREIFIGEKQIVGGVKLVPIDNAAVQKDFFEKVMKLDANKYTSIWTKKGFRDGLNPPAVKASDAEVIAAVKSTPGAVGYVSVAPTGVKVIQKY